MMWPSLHFTCMKTVIKPYLNNRLSNGSILWHQRSVEVTAEHRRVVIDICQVYVHCGYGTQWRSAAITSLYRQKVVPADLIVQRMGNQNGTWQMREERGNRNMHLDLVQKEDFKPSCHGGRRENVVWIYRHMKNTPVECLCDELRHSEFQRSSLVSSLWKNSVKGL